MESKSALQVDNVRIAGIVAAVPPRIANETALVPLFGDRAAAVVATTGMQFRSLAPRGTRSLDLSVFAAQRLLDALGVDPNAVNGIVSVGFTPRFALPGDATQAQNLLGISQDTFAIDLHMACAGYPYGLAMAGLLAAQTNGTILLLNSDVQSPRVSPYDKSVAPLMSDAGTATLVTYEQGAPAWQFSYFSNGAGAASLMIPAGSGDKAFEASDLEYSTDAQGNRRRPVDIHMNGLDVFRFVVKDVAQFIGDFIAEVANSEPPIDFFVPHQANMYLIKELSKKLGFADDRVWKSGHVFGNPASASVPLTLAYEGQQRGGLLGPTKLLIAGFGAGLAIGVGLVSVDEDTHLEWLEYNIPSRMQ